METKTLALVEAKASDAGPGTIEGYASTFSGVDSYGDTIDPGAYRETLPDFVRDGFLAADHDWGSRTRIGTIKEAHEDSRGLYFVAEYHSDPESQRLRNLARERMDRGKSVQLSIGYEALEWEFRKVETPVKGPYGEFTDQLRALKKIKLYEISDVAVAADPRALATGVKHRPYREQAEGVLVDLRDLVARSYDIAELRGRDRDQKAGRVLSEANRTRLRALLEALQAAGGDIEELLSTTEPAPKGADLASLYGEFLRTQARLNGVLA